MIIFWKALFTIKEMGNFPLNSLKSIRSVWLTLFIRFMCFYLCTFFPVRVVYCHMVTLTTKVLSYWIAKTWKLFKWAIKGTDVLLDEVTNSRQKLLPCTLYIALRFAGTWEITGDQFAVQQLGLTIKYFFPWNIFNNKIFRKKVAHILKDLFREYSWALGLELGTERN